MSRVLPKVFFGLLGLILFALLATACGSDSWAEPNDSSGDRNITVNEAITIQDVKNASVFYTMTSPLGVELECKYVHQIDGSEYRQGYGRFGDSCWVAPVQ